MGDRELQGEGNYEAAREYNQAARRFARTSNVEEAAREARRAIEIAPRVHQQAEAEGKARARAHDTAASRGVDEWGTLWERARVAMRRDWEQTVHDFSSTHGRELHQTAMDTLRQLFGKKRRPASGEPPGVVLEPDMAERAQRYGFETADVYTGEWTEEIDSAMRTHWNQLHPSAAWEQYRPVAMYGWWYRRNRQLPLMPGDPI